MKVHPYLNFDGKAEEAFEFYSTVFGVEIKDKMKMGDSQGGENLSEDEKNRIMHISLPLGEGVFLMASDIFPSAGHTLRKGNQTYVMLDVETKEEADRLFKGLSEGGEIEMEMEDMFWGAYFGSFTDKFGILWMIHRDNQGQN